MIEEGYLANITNRPRFRHVPSDSVPFDYSVEKVPADLQLYNVTAEVRNRFATLKMNGHHKFNMFTSGFLDDLDRALYGMEMMGDDIRLIHFGANDPHTFSRGTDIKTLHYYQKNKDMDPIVEYLNKLYNFHIAFARNNKPLISTPRGHIENSGACLVGSAGVSTISHDARLVFNETTSKNRIIPHAGASYYLTRMPGEMGTFLALTSTPFTGSEAQGVLGLADYMFNEKYNTWEEICNEMNYLDQPTFAKEIHDTDGITENVFKHKFENLVKKEVQPYLHKKKFRDIEADKFISPWDAQALETQRSKDLIETEYKDFLRDNLEHKVLHDTTKLGSGTTGHYLNHYDHYVSYFLSKIPFEEPDLTDSIVRRYEKDINRCFYANSIDEIIKNLKRENTKFSKYCLKRLEENDRTALNVTLGLLRRAVKSSYSECCHLEYKALLNLLKNEHNVHDKTPMTPELIEEYFKTPAEYKNVDIRVKDHAPLPTRKYYKKYADHMRLLMNEHNSYSPSIRDGYKREVQSELRELGIDIRDSGLTTQIIRTSIWNKEYAENAKNYEKQLEGYFVNDDKVSERFYVGVAEQIGSLETGEIAWSNTHKDYYELVNDLVYKCYVDALMKNIKFLLDKNKDVHKVKKKRFFLKLKKFFFENRLLDSPSRKGLIEALRANCLPKVPTTLDADDIYSNIFDSFKKIKLETKEDLYKLLTYEESYSTAEMKGIPRRMQIRRLLRTDGYDPFVESKYWSTYMKYKAIREDHAQRFEDRQKMRNELNKQILENKEAVARLTELNEKKFLEDLLREQFNPTLNNTFENVKSLNDLISHSLKEHPELGFIGKPSALWAESDPKLVQDFKNKFKDLLSKYIQIGVLNTANDDLKSGSLNFMKAEQSETMNIIDSFLVEKVNTSTIHRMMDNVLPALNLTMKEVIKQEAKKILYSLNYPENLSPALLHLYSAQENPELLKAQMFIEVMKNEFKDDPEVVELLAQRPANLFMYKGYGTPGVLEKVETRLASLVDENPIEALQALCESICFANFDVSHGDPDKKAEIERRLRSHFGDIDKPLEDAIQLGITLLSAHHSLNQDPKELQVEAVED